MSLSEELHAWDAGRARSRQTKDARAEGKWGVGPSDVSSCAKAVEYRENPPEGYVPIETDKGAAIMGTLLHNGITEIRRERYPNREFALEIPIPGLDKPGEADEYDPETGTVVDYKSAGSWMWDQVQDEADVGHVGQAHVYAWGLLQQGRKVETVEIIYLHREKGWTVHHSMTYSPDVARAALDRLTGMLSRLDAGLSLPRERRGPGLDPICTSYCPAVRHCWGLDDLEEGESAQAHTLIHDDVDRENALRSYTEAHQRETQAKRAKAFARALLDGSQGGQYGQFKLSWSGGGVALRPDDKGYIAALEQTVERLGGALPEQPMNEVRSSERINVRRA